MNLTVVVKTQSIVSKNKKQTTVETQSITSLQNKYETVKTDQTNRHCEEETTEAITDTTDYFLLLPRSRNDALNDNHIVEMQSIAFLHLSIGVQNPKI